MSVGFELGPFFIHYYGVIIALGALAGVWLVSYRARRQGQDPEFIWDAFSWVLIGGVLGARLWHIFTPPPSNIAQGLTTSYYLTHPLDALAIWRGGLGIPGAVIGGGLALYIYCRKRRESFATWVDLIVPSLALGQAVGRWGNFVNQELYGLPTNLPWGIYIDKFNRVSGYEQFSHFHPTFLYESIWNLANMVLLLWLGKKFADRIIAGDLLLVYLIVYPIGRFLLEFLRLDSAELAGLNANQTFMAVVAILAALLLVLRHRKQ